MRELIYTLRDNLKSQWWSIQMLKLQTIFKCFLVCFAMMQVKMSLSLLFIEFLGSCSRWKVTNGVMSCAMGPTDFYLKFWINILNFICVHLGSSWYSSGFIMIFIWVHHVWMKTWVFGLIYVFHMTFLALSISSGFSTYIRMLLDNTFLDFPWKLCKPAKVNSASSCSCFEGLCGPCTVPNLIRALETVQAR